MAKKGNNNVQTTIPTGNVYVTPLEEVMPQSMLPYAEFVILDRALPRVEDGLKPVQRRILYTMAEMGLTPDKPHKKSARIVGDCMGKYHPHGDSSVYDAMVRMAQDFNMRMTLVNGHGNFGSVDGDPAAAMRYTEARLSKLSSEMLRDLDKETVDFYPTFDDTGMQPTVLPSRFPNMLVNGSDGIAVGMATNIPPHNLGEVIDGVIAMIDNPEIDVDGLMQYIPAPDFPTGALIMGRNGIKKAYRTGRGNITIRSRCEVEEYKSGNMVRNRIVVTEIPYQVNKAKLIESMADLVKDKKIEGISDIREESDRDGMRIVIELKKEANPQVVLNTLYKHTNLQISDGLIMLALVDGTPKILNLREFIYYYLEHQKDIITRRTRFDLAKTEERAHILRGLVIAQASINEVVKVCREAVDKADCVKKLTDNFELDERQATAVAELRLYRLSHLEVDKLKEELAQLEATIADLKDILAHEYRVPEIIKNDLLEIKRKYPSVRKTELAVDLDGEIIDADLIPVEQVVISMTHSGYVKRLPVSEYHAQNRGGKGITAHRPKDEDFIEKMFVCSSHDDVLLFSDRGKVYRIKAYEIPEATRISRGRAVVNLVQIAQDEKINALIHVQEGQKGYIAFATKQGLIKKTRLSEFARINRNGKIAIKLNDGDNLLTVAFTDGKQEVMIAASSGKCIRFDESNIRSMGRDTAGVKAMKLGAKDCLVDMLVVDPEKDVLTVTSNGYGKRTDLSDYRIQGRAGMGIKAGVFNEVTGTLSCMKQVTDADDVMIISEGGTIIRMHCADISRIGRNTKGVRLMRLKDGSVATVALTARDEEEAAETLIEAAPELVIPEPAAGEEPVINEGSADLDFDGAETPEETNDDEI